eukprot:1172907-Pleurochrysis_carterae.AAC.3
MRACHRRRRVVQSLRLLAHQRLRATAPNMRLLPVLLLCALSLPWAMRVQRLPAAPSLTSAVRNGYHATPATCSSSTRLCTPQLTATQPANTPRVLETPVYCLNKIVIDTVKGAIDARTRECKPGLSFELCPAIVYKDRDFARFYVLETVARVPYFAYLSVLHLRETFGVRDAGMLRTSRVNV